MKLFLSKVKSSTSEAPTIQPTTLSPSTIDGAATETTNMIYPTTTMENDNMFTTDTVPMITDFTTLDGSETSEGEILETEFPPLIQSRTGSSEDGIIEGILRICSFAELRIYFNNNGIQITFNIIDLYYK